ncbi:MAG: biopolymer transporter ExbD [Pirellulaceae bacterium]|nr:biopolymer transporter ExbD [Planctomycetaceae bacterium]
MPYTFHCPNCGTEQPASDSLAGQQARCPGCEQMVPVPTRDEALAAEKSKRHATAATAVASPPGNGDADSGSFVSFGDGEKVDREAEMDMTPMVDVTFLLLIFFMVTAAFTVQKTIEVPKPENTDQPSTVQLDEEQEDEAVTIHIDEDNMYTVITPDDEFECPSVQEMYVRLRDAMSATPKPERLIVQANGEATHERVITALDAGAEVGLTDVQLVTVEDDF